MKKETNIMKKETKNKLLNECARILYSSMGYEVKKGYSFQDAHHPQERACFVMAIKTCNFWRNAFKKDTLQNTKRVSK